jgi:hypothetical protein
MASALHRAQVDVRDPPIRSSGRADRDPPADRADGRGESDLGRQVGRALTAADDGVFDRPPRPDLRPGWKVDVVGSAALGHVAHSSRPDALPGTQSERVRRTLRALDQKFVSQASDSIGERHLRRMLANFIEHYHYERNHQGLGNELIDPGVQRRASDPPASDSAGSSTSTTVRRDSAASSASATRSSNGTLRLPARAR